MMTNNKNVLTVWTQWRRHRQCAFQTVLQQEYSNLPSSTNERCSDIRYHVNMAKSPGMHLAPVLENKCSQFRWSWLGPGWGSPFYPLDGLAARTKGSPATPQLQRQERPLPWQKVLMPQEWHIVHWCLGMQRMCQSTQHCSHWGLPRWGWSVNDWLVLGTRLVTGHTVICR